MKISISMLLIILINFQSGLAQNRAVSGNGSIKTQTRILPTFHSISLNIRADVYISCGRMSMASITTDANLHDCIDLSVKKGTLLISLQEGKWIESGKVEIDISLPFLNSLETRGLQTGIGKVMVSDINVSEFECDITYGDIFLEGQVEKFKIRSSNQSYYKDRGRIFAKKLLAKEVEANVLGSNSVEVYASKTLQLHLMHDATLVYDGNPTTIKATGQAKRISETAFSVKTIEDRTGQTRKKQHVSIKSELTYIELEVRNNSLQRRNFIIRGPSENGREFSYGFPMMPYTRKTKKVPIGTQIYLDSGFIRKILVTIAAEDEGTVKNLF